MTERGQPLFFALDAGNTRVKFGLFDAATLPLPRCLWHSFVMCGEPLPTALFEQVPGGATVRAFLSGSNPAAISAITSAWRDDWPRLDLLADRRRLPLTIDVDAPEKVGFDRLLNAVAALQLRATGQPVVIVDSGTATTVDFVDHRGAFCGGAILPGIGMSARALNAYTALLPLIPAPEVTAEQPAVIGRNTQDAILSGLYWGHVGAVRELVGRMMPHSSKDDSTLVLVTGGAGASVAPWFPAAQVCPHLPLQGLVLSLRP